MAHWLYLWLEGTSILIDNKILHSLLLLKKVKSLLQLMQGGRKDYICYPAELKLIRSDFKSD